jgi:integrase
MGGSGSGGTFSDIDRQELLKKLRASENATKDVGFETEINAYIGQLQAVYNDRDYNAVQNHLNEIELALSEDIDETVSLLFGGSVAKRTYVDGLSDIDALVLLGESELKTMTPEQVKEYFFQKLKERYPKTAIKEGALAVTVKFPDAEIQLLPAIKYKTGYRIADVSGKLWSFIRPRKFTELLTKINQDNGNKVVPTIKLAKAIISDFPKNRQLSGYHVEALAVQIFQNYAGPKTPKALLTHFFSEAPRAVLKPLPDVTGQSEHLDSYLGSEKSLNRRAVSDALNLISRRMQSADNARTVQAWKEILGVS